jgi:hypothetical protein
MADKTHPAAAADLLVGWDTEFVRNNGRDFLPEDDAANSVLCITFNLYCPQTGRSCSFIHHLEPGGRRKRPKLATILGWVWLAADGVGLFNTPDGRFRKLNNAGGDTFNIHFIGHFTRADLPVCRDFEKVKRRFDGPRGTFCTTNRSTILDVRQPGTGRRRRVSLRLYDTKLLAPAGYGSLKRLGEAAGFHKLSVPDVIDETGTLVPGIVRMDLVKDRHPSEFAAYAIRDAEVALAWYLQVADYCASIGLPRVPPTLGAISVAFIKSGDTRLLASVLGRKTSANGAMGKEALPELAAHQALMADAFHGGWNECHSVGLYGPEDSAGRDSTDIDLHGAYTTALAFAREIDWANVESIKDLDRLATLDAMTFAAVDFEFPKDTRFPSLACDSGDYGLVFPLSGSTVVTGPELVVALNQGAKIIVRAGVRLNFLDADGLRPFASTAQAINKQRAEAKAAAGGADKSALELVAKDCGNAVYGKCAQAVCSMKSQPDIRRQFNPRNGLREPIDRSGITAPHVAAYASGLPRAVMGEILANTPPDIPVMSVTTDGILSFMPMETAQQAADGPVCRLFKSLRVLVDAKGSPEILETKHVARRVLSVKTRGNFTVEPAEIKPGKMSALLCARAGHRLETPIEDKQAEVQEWLRIHREREYDTKMRGTQFHSLQEQWAGNSDLVDIETEVRANFDYDMKRRPINVRKGPDGLIKFETAPWDSLRQFLEWREDLDAWRKATRSVLKTLEDWERFKAWRAARRTRSAGQRSPWQQHLLVRFATGRILPLKGRGKSSKAPMNAVSTGQIAELLTNAGVPEVTGRIVKHAADRESALAQTPPPPMLLEDHFVLENLRRLLPAEVLLALTSETGKAYSDHNHRVLAHDETQIGNSLKPNADVPPITENKSISPKSIEGRTSLGYYSEPEITPSTASENTPAGAHEQTPEPPVETTADTPADTPAETNGAAGTNSSTDANGTTDAPPPPPPTRPADPRYDSPALTRAMDAIVPVIETRLRRQGVTSKHIRLGRAAAIADGETEADLPMATLVHALALKDGLPPEFAVAVIAGLVTALTSIAPATPQTPMRTN